MALKTVNAIVGEPIPLGTQGDNLLTRVVFDVSGWETEGHSNGVFVLLHRRPMDGLPYPVPVAHNMGPPHQLLWDVTDYDTAQPAEYGTATLRYYSGENLAELWQEQTWQTHVSRSVTGDYPAYPQDTRQKFVDMVSWETARSEAAKTAAEAARDEAQTAQSAAEVARDEAQTAKTAAENAQDMAEKWAEGDPGNNSYSAKSWAKAASGHADTAESWSRQAEAWAQSGSNPDGTDATSKSAKSWATAAGTSAENAAASASLAEAWAHGDPGNGQTSAKSWAETAASSAITARQAASAALLNVGRTMFYVDANGHLKIQNPQWLGTTGFTLNPANANTAPGHLEVMYYGG